MAGDHPPHRLPNGRARSDSRYPDHREWIAKARQAAEALFAPKPRSAEPPGAGPVPTAGQAKRVVRISETSKPTSAPGAAVKAPIEAEPAPVPTIPASQLVRIRTWVKYGMPVAQVAKLYGVPVDEVARVLRKA